MSSHDPMIEGSKGEEKNSKKRANFIGLFTLLSIIILIVFSGDIRWSWLWVYTATTVAVLILSAAIVPRGVIAERGRKKTNVEKWDRVITGLIYVPWFVQFFVAALDHRFGWSPELPVWVHILGVGLYLAGIGLVLLAMRANLYFSTAVRIQHDRGHTVCLTGPYAIIRHPGYAGMIIEYLAVPVILGSWCGWIPQAVIVGLLILRTGLEDRALAEKLEGYREYTRQVRYRLIPWIW